MTPLDLSTSSGWTWVVVAGLGTFHGLNPAMGWLFAVALGLYQRSRRVVLLSLVPIALGHAMAAACVLAAGLSLSMSIDHHALNRICGVILIGWAAWHALRGHRVRSRVGMQVKFAGLTAWSFVMSSVHGAGLMLIPALLPVCDGLAGDSSTLPSSASGLLTGVGPVVTVAVTALMIHTVAMLLTTGIVSLLVFDRFGLAFLRTKWVNVDLLWTASLAGCGIVQLGM
ncbi:hypothetical protein [Paraburkholderia saeva]|uniref:hypothetical protein n=1 Tax=Paraburkholderia saeva TaxID=2777537 RepID=UPI001D7E9B3B|nr:hypothetical protein [Paraburkholderia saeva]CAG4908443.1 hypothetical protein R52603_03624 [Paraburkholderia saeva]CAG4913421.1 hypothetical protein R70241_04132 [Paraburkholderia saeva]